MTRATAKAIVLPILNKATEPEFVVMPQGLRSSFRLALNATLSETTRDMIAQRFADAADTLERQHIIEQLKRIGAIG